MGEDSRIKRNKKNEMVVSEKWDYKGSLMQPSLADIVNLNEAQRKSPKSMLICKVIGGGSFWAKKLHLDICAM